MTPTLRKLLLAMIVVAAGALIAIIFFVNGLWDVVHRQNPDLPEWFDPAYRIKKNRAIIFPWQTIQEKGKGKKAGPAGAAPPGPYTDEWLEKHFTHYIDVHNAFTWLKPKVIYPSDGKIMAGIKVIVGEQVNDLSLICAVSADGQPENMFVQTMNLRERSQGPPPMPKDD